MGALPREIAGSIERETVRSPLGVLLGLELLELSEGHARVAMPYRPELTTGGDTVHGGAIAALIDTAATASVWAHPAASADDRGATVGFCVNYLRAARGQALTATSTLRRRGAEISTAEITVRDASGGEIAVALLTYNLSSREAP